MKVNFLLYLEIKVPTICRKSEEAQNPNHLKSSVKFSQLGDDLKYMESASIDLFFFFIKSKVNTTI